MFKLIVKVVNGIIEAIKEWEAKRWYLRIERQLNEATFGKKK